MAMRWISLRKPSLHSNTNGLTLGKLRPVSGLAAMHWRICAMTTAATEKVLVNAIGVSSRPSSATWTRPTLLPKPLSTTAAAGTRSRNRSPACGRTTVTPVCTSLASSVQWPTVTPATSVMALRGPGGRLPMCGNGLDAVNFRIQRIAQAVAQQIEGQHGKKNRQTGKQRHMRCVDHVGARLVEHGAPFGCRRLRPHAEETQTGCRDDRGSQAHAEVHNDGRDGAGQNVARDDGPVRCP